MEEQTELVEQLRERFGDLEAKFGGYSIRELLTMDETPLEKLAYSDLSPKQQEATRILAETVKQREADVILARLASITSAY